MRGEGRGEGGERREEKGETVLSLILCHSAVRTFCEYSPCGCNETCDGACDATDCTEGCFCLDNYVEHNGECIHHTAICSGNYV